MGTCQPCGCTSLEKAGTVSCFGKTKKKKQPPLLLSLSLRQVSLRRGPAWTSPARRDVLWLRQTGCVWLKMDQIESRRPAFLWRDSGGSGVCFSHSSFIRLFFTFLSLRFSLLPPAFYLKSLNTVDDSGGTAHFFPSVLASKVCASCSSRPQAAEESVNHSSVLLPTPV